MDVESKLIEALARAEAAEKLADKALNMAMDAMVQVRAMKESTHKVEYVNPWTEDGSVPLAEGVKQAPAPEPELKASPFALFEGFQARRGSLNVEKSPQTPGEKMEAALWGDATSEVD